MYLKTIYLNTWCVLGAVDSGWIKSTHKLFVIGKTDNENSKKPIIKPRVVRDAVKNTSE